LARNLGYPLVVVVRILNDYVAVGVDLRQCEDSFFQLSFTDSWQGFLSGRLCLLNHLLNVGSTQERSLKADNVYKVSNILQFLKARNR
jgi:hypothetical protein